MAWVEQSRREWAAWHAAIEPSRWLLASEVQAGLDQAEGSDRCVLCGAIAEAGRDECPRCAVQVSEEIRDKRMVGA